jgi:glycosyltransferase involved in cell wall biosynthesis
MKAAAKNSAKILTVSETSKKDILDYYDIPEDKIIVVYNGIDHSRFFTRIQDSESRIQRFKEKYKIVGEYILYAGMWKRHKNLERMLLAFEEFILQRHSRPDRESILDPRVKPEDDRGGIQLVMAGKIDNNEPEVIDLIKKINSSLNSKFKILL